MVTITFGAILLMNLILTAETICRHHGFYNISKSVGNGKYFIRSVGEISFHDIAPVNFKLAQFQVSQPMITAQNAAAIKTTTPSLKASVATAAAAPAAPATPTDLSLHGGVLMTQTVKMYNIWLSNDSYFSSNSTGIATAALVDGFVQVLGSSAWSGVLNTYKNNAGVAAATNLVLANSIQVAVAGLSNINVTYIAVGMVNLINAKIIPLDTNAVYNLLFSGVAFDGFCTSWCAFHTFFTVTSQNRSYQLKLVIVGDPSRNPNGTHCEAIKTVNATANGLIGGDSMVSLLAHEISEAITNPDLATGYYYTGSDGSKVECGDKCGWNFGTLLSPNSNVVLGGKSYLIQQQWVYKPPNSVCAMHL